MEQEKHSTQQEVRKPVTKATARHLRRKRFKNARRAEEQQYLNRVNFLSRFNGVSSQEEQQTSDALKDNGADVNDKSTPTAQQTTLEPSSAKWANSVFSSSANSVNLSLSDPLNDLTIAAILRKLASLDSNHSEQANLPRSHCSSNVADEARCMNGAEDLPQTTNGKKNRKKKKRARSLIAGATSSDSNSNSAHNCPADESVKNGQALEHSVSDGKVDDPENSARNDTEAETIAIEGEQVETSAANDRVNCSLSANDSSSSVAGSGQSDSSFDSKGNEGTNASSPAAATATTAEGPFCSSTKTRKEMSASQGAKKANAKMQANNSTKNEPSMATGKSPRKSPKKSTEARAATIDATAAMSSRDATDAAADPQSSPSARRVESKRNAERNSVENGSSPKSEKSDGSTGKPVSSAKKADEKAGVPEKTREEVKAQREAKKAARAKAKNGSGATAAAMGGDDNKSNKGASVTADDASPKSAETSALEEAASDSRKAAVADDAQSSRSARRIERNAEENCVPGNPTATSESEMSKHRALEPDSSVEMTDGKSSLPKEMDIAVDARSSRPARETEQIVKENDSQGDSVAISKSEESKMPSVKATDVKSSLPEKTKEKVKAEREAKKTAKAAAKAKAKSKKTEEVTDKVKNDNMSDASAVDSEIVVATKSDTAQCQVIDAQKPDVAVVSSQSPRVTREVEESSKGSETQQQPSRSSQATESSVVVPARQDSTASENDGKTDGKSKAELRAERRAKQEAQRAAKQQQASAKQQPSSKKSSDATNREAPSVKPQPRQQPITETTSAKRHPRKDNDHEVNLFKHLYNERESLISLTKVPVNSTIHPAIVRLGAQYAGRTIVGSNARCLALLDAVKDVIQDFVKPEQADFTRSLEVCLRELLAYLHRYRPVAVSMQNAMRHLNWYMSNIPVTMPTDEAKSKLIGIIDTYRTEQIELAGKAISITIQTKISNGNIILIYGFSSLIYNILVDAHAAGKQFRVIVVDGRPWLEGREQLKRLAKHGIDCSYILINAVSFIMPEVSKVFLGAHAILANGAVMSRVGTSQIALIAKAFNVPVLVACETHKTCVRVQTDSIVYNELGNADDLVNSYQVGNSRKSLLTNWRARKSLNLLNITYDVTPADLITAVVTELAILPCTSVPVILRIKPSEF